MRHCAPILLLALAVPQAFGQSVISARSGLINFSEGDVLVDGQPFQRRFGRYTSLKEGSDLVTRSGRAEILLTPNAYLRVGEESAIRMVSDSLGDTRIELLGGSVLLDSSTAPGKAMVTIMLRDSVVRFLAPGKFRLDSDPPQLRVFQGEAGVDNNGRTVRVESSQLLPLDGAPIVRRITEGSDNLLDLWSDERHSLIASSLTDAQSIGNPLLDLDSMIPGNSAYPGYIPLAGYLPLIVGPYAGPIMPGGYSTFGYSLGSIYSPYSIFVIFGGFPGYPLPYPHTLRPGGIVGFSPGFGGLRPPVGAIGPGPIRSFAPRPITPPRPVAPHLGGRR